MGNAGFNAATDIFSIGEDWAVKSSDLNASVNTAECKNRKGDTTHRDQYGARIAPTAAYECIDDGASLPALGTVVTIDGKKVAISRMRISTQAGQAPQLTVEGTQIESTSSAAVRTYDLPTLSLSTRHRAQDVTGELGNSTPDNLVQADFTFEVDITLAEPKGTIVASDASNGRYEAAYTFASGDGTAPAVPSASGSKVVSSPLSKSSPENDYVSYSFTVSDTLTGTDA